MFTARYGAPLSERLSCVREAENCRDPFAVAVERSGVTIGHVPRSICSMFLRRGGRIDCEITGARRYSEDLPQGGLEIPCKLTLRGDSRDVHKLEKLIKDAITPSGTLSCQAEKENGPPTKRLKHTIPDFNQITNGEKLSYLSINLAQQLLKKQFPSVNGLQSTLLQTKPKTGDHLNKLSTAMEIIGLLPQLSTVKN